MKKEYNKLVRDKIPEKLERAFQTTHTRKLSGKDLEVQLERLLLTEVQEYHREKTVDKLADIVEVVYALAKIKGISKEELEFKKTTKLISDGSYDEGIYLEFTEHGPMK